MCLERLLAGLPGRLYFSAITKLMKCAWGKWISLFEMSVQAVISIKRLKRRNHLPWINGEIRKQLGESGHFGKWQSAMDHLWHGQNTRNSRNWLKSEISRSLSEHINRMATQSRSNPKRFWSFMNSVLRKQGIPELLKTPSGISVCSSAEKADAFNRYFHSVFTGPVCPAVHSLSGAPGTLLISAPNIQQEEVRRELSLLNPLKPSGPDNIPAGLLREGASEIVPSLTKLFQLSLHLESVPSAWKDANVISLYKCGDKSDAKNYRPHIYGV